MMIWISMIGGQSRVRDGACCYSTKESKRCCDCEVRFDKISLRTFGIVTIGGAPLS